jgi:hypothetical protein
MALRTKKITPTIRETTLADINTKNNIWVSKFKISKNAIGKTNSKPMIKENMLIQKKIE